MKQLAIIFVTLCVGLATTNFGPPTKVKKKFTKAKALKRMNMVKIGTNIGDTAPELAFSSPTGKTYKLSDLRGKIVLVDFWASWCGPCRKESPNLVRAYGKYSGAKFKKAKGFEIFSVSLDMNKAAWIKAIEADKLNWRYHVSDLKRWQSEAAALYGIQSIPASFLLDENGVIIAKNLKGTKLDFEMDKLVNKL